MVYTRTKNIKKHDYYYTVRSVREGKKVRQVFVSYEGAVDPIYKTPGRKRETTARLFVRNFEGVEEGEIEAGLKSEVSFTRQRARILFLSKERKSCREIAEVVGCDQRKARDAVKAFNSRGTACLKKRGK